MLAAGCAIGALLLLAAALVAANASGIVRDLSNDNAQALAGKAAAEVASDIGEIQGLGRSMAQTLGAAHAAGVRDRKVLSEMIKPAASASPMILGAGSWRSRTRWTARTRPTWAVLNSAPTSSASSRPTG